MRWSCELVCVRLRDMGKGRWVRKGASSQLPPASPGPFRKGEGVLHLTDKLAEAHTRLPL